MMYWCALYTNVSTGNMHSFFAGARLQITADLLANRRDTIGNGRNSAEGVLADTKDLKCLGLARVYIGYQRKEPINETLI